MVGSVLPEIFCPPYTETADDGETYHVLTGFICGQRSLSRLLALDGQWPKIRLWIEKLVMEMVPAPFSHYRGGRQAAKLVGCSMAENDAPGARHNQVRH